MCIEGINSFARFSSMNFIPTNKYSNDVAEPT